DIRVPAALYLQCLKRYDVHRSDGSIRIDGDSHFAFLTPEAAFEDTDLLDAMVQGGLLTARFVASLAMTDFSNPVFSHRRSALLRYVPETAGSANPADDLQNRFVDQIRAAVAAGRDGAGQPDSPEREFLANWDTVDHQTEFARRIVDYFRA